jgi:D-3-phosphoglycerate dehydrogenase
VLSLTDPVEPLILDLLEWLGSAPRPYDEVMSAWRTSCPRLPVWEEANERGFIERQRVAGSGQLVALSSLGRAHLLCHRPVPAA